MMCYRRFTGSALLRSLPRSVFVIVLGSTHPSMIDVNQALEGIEETTNAVIVRTHIVGASVRLTIRPRLYIACNHITFDK